MSVPPPGLRRRTEHNVAAACRTAMLPDRNADQYEVFGAAGGAPDPDDGSSSSSSDGDGDRASRNNGGHDEGRHGRDSRQSTDRRRDSEPPRRPQGGPPGGPPGGGPPGGGPRRGSDASSSQPESPHHRRSLSRIPTHPADARPRDISIAPRHVRSPSYLHEREQPLRPDKWNDPNAEYIESQLRIIRQAIRDRVGREMADVPALKNLKNVPAPEKYSGRDDVDEFMSWLKLLLRWMELSRVAGPELDGYRVNLLGQFLVNAARDWYDETIDNIHITGRVWVFEDAVCALFRRFIHMSNARAAADKFHAARYRKDTGVNGLWEYMTKQTLKMPEPPDNYTFNRKFVDALPEEISIPILENQRISQERTPPE
ncbi:hypothetical protein K466DRAFT_571029, partial [Polyporus arcularius HHB13444]